MTAVAFFVGALCSMASGVIGMYISVKSNVRTAAAARHSLVEAVQVAMRGGAVSGFLVVALSLLGVWGIFVAYGGFTNPAVAPFLIVGFGFGASFVALFAQLGGGIYTKAADVGSTWLASRGRHPRGRSATPRSSPTSSATTSATAPAVVRTCSSPPPPRTSGP